MRETRVLLVFPGSLYGGRWADGPRVKPELVHLHTELRRAGFGTAVLDLEAELGNPQDDVARESHLQIGGSLLAGLEADLVVISCWSALQYTASLAFAQRVREQLPEAVIAVCGHHVSVRPDDFNDPAAPFDWLIAGEAESAVVALARQIDAGERETGACGSVEGTPLPLDAAHLPDYAAYPYAEEGQPELGVFLSRGCPYNAPSCMLRAGGTGWHAFPPAVAVRLVDEVAALRPARLLVLDPAFGYESGWRRETLDLLASGDRRAPALAVTARPEQLRRIDVDKILNARAGLVLEVGTLSAALLTLTSAAASPRKAVEHTLELLEYLGARGVTVRARFTFNQPGETEETAAETLDALERLASAVPTTSVAIEARPWAFEPIGEDDAIIAAPASRYGTRIEHPEWWKEHASSRELATAVIPSAALAGRPAGDESYWRPRFEEVRDALAAKLTDEARGALWGHETPEPAADGVPHGWWTEPRWH